MNLTLSLDDKLVERGRELATRQGTSLNRMIRDYLAQLTAERSAEELVRELDALWSESGGDSRGWSWNRDEIHERPRLR